MSERADRILEHADGMPEHRDSLQEHMNGISEPAYGTLEHLHGTGPEGLHYVDAPSTRSRARPKRSLDVRLKPDATVIGRYRAE